MVPEIVDDHELEGRDAVKDGIECMDTHNLLSITKSRDTKPSSFLHKTQIGTLKDRSATTSGSIPTKS